MIISRRRFLAGLAATGTVLFNTRPVKSQQIQSPGVPSIGELRLILEDQFSPNVAAVRLYYKEQNLCRAYELIRPTSHVESAIVVWASYQEESFAHIVEEYCRRRSGMTPRLFSHEVLKSRLVSFPYTHQILFFNEQVDALVTRITGSCDENYARRMWLAQFPFPSGDEVCLDDFTNSVRADYGYFHPDTRDEIAQMYHFIQNSYEKALSYYWCSVIVSEAQRSKGKEV